MKDKKIDRRVKVTMMLLEDALISAMQTTHISKISVKQLCEIADINRITFYAHFQDQYQLLESICNQAFDNIENYMERQDFHEKSPISYQTLTKILEYIKQNSDLFRALLSDHSDVDIQRKFITLVMKYTPYEITNPRMKEYFSAFGLAGCVSILQIWLKEGMLDTPSDLAKIILQAINHGITSIR